LFAVPAYSFRDPEVLAFVVIPFALVGLLAWATAVAWRRAGESRDRARRSALLVALVAAAWMAATWTAASRGLLLDIASTPPPFVFLLAGILLLAARLAFGRVGGRLARHVPLWALVGVQAFRLPLELAMHRLAQRGIMPEHMSYTGLNFDIVTGITAIGVAWAVWRGVGGRRLATAWNVLGGVLLLNIVVISILSTPRFAVFGADRLNTFVMVTPFVWLPAVMVLAALAGHLIVWRAIRLTPAAPQTTQDPR
jgi:hypothetical protein